MAENNNKPAGYGTLDIENDTNGNGTNGTTIKPPENEPVVVVTMAVDDDDDEFEPPPPKKSIIGIVFIVLGAFSFSIMFLTVKLMADTNTFTLVFYRSLIQIAISLGSLYHDGIDPLGPRDVRFWLVIRAVFGALAVCAWFFGIQILPLPDAVTLQFTTPPFAAAFAVVLVGEQWLPIDIIGAVVCLSGVALIAHPTWLFGSDAADTDEVDAGSGPSAFMKALAVMITTGGAAMAGIAYVCVRKIGDRASAVVMVLYYGTLSIPMVFLGSGLLEGEWNVWGTGHFGFKDYILLLFMGFGGYGGQWFTNLGLQNETAATATLATSTQIVWTYIFELMFLHESINGWSIAGTGLILGYMLVVAAMKMIESQQEEADLVDPEKEALLDKNHHGGSSNAENRKLLERKSSSFTETHGENVAGGP